MAEDQVKDQVVAAKVEPTPEAPERSPRRAIVHTIEVVNKEAAVADIKSVDAREDLEWGDDVVAPLYVPDKLQAIVEDSGHLTKCIEALKTNIDGFGHVFRPFVMDEQIKDEGIRQAIKQEQVRLKNFFNNCCIDDASFIDMRLKTREDVLGIGYGAWEVVRSASGAIRFLKHVPGQTIRLTKRGDPIPYRQKYPEIDENGFIQIRTRTVPKRFRRFVQIETATGLPRKIWFKEFGDPRVMSSKDGHYAGDGDPIPPSERATEILFWRRPSSRTAYGVPEWVSELYTVLGDRSGRRVNFITLSNNNIPSMAILVSNGALTEGSIKRIEEFVATKIQGNENYSRFMIIEAEGASDDMGDLATMKLEIKPLTQEQMRDMMFQDYLDGNRRDIRELFRLPALIVGASDDYSRNTSDNAMKVADEQVFDPARRAFDEVINSQIMPHLGVQYHYFESLGPNITNPTEILSAMTAGERSGAMTPRKASQLIDTMIGRELPQVQGIDMDKPFSLQMAEAVKNQAGGTVGEQVTALKGMDQDEPDKPRGGEVSFRRRQKRWAEMD